MRCLTFATCALLLCGPSLAVADDSTSLTIRNHHFEPRTITVKAGVKVAISVTNAGTEPAEFESSELNREKVIPPGKTVTIYVGPLEPGTYPFFDDFDQANTGQIVAR